MPYKDADIRRRYHREWVKQNKEKMRAYREKWRKKDPERARRLQSERFKRYYHSGKGKQTAAQWRKVNAEKFNRASRDRRFALKIQVIEHYGGVCACCGEFRLEFLQIDHINGDGKAHRDHLKLHGGTSIYSWLRSHDFPKGFRVLCANCNQARGAWGYCPHEEERNES